MPGHPAEGEGAFAKLTMQDWRGLSGQRWAFVPRGEQDYLLHNPKLDAYVEMHESSPFLVDISAAFNTSPWHLIPAEQKSFFYLYSPKSARCASPFEEGRGAPVHGQRLSNLPSQKWLLQPVEVHLEGAKGFRFHLLDSAACTASLPLRVEAGASSLLLRILPADEGRGPAGEPPALGFELRRPDGTLFDASAVHPRLRATVGAHGLTSCLITEPEEGEWQVRFLSTEGAFSFAAMVDAGGDKEGVAEAAFATLSEPTRRHMRSILAAEALARTTTAADHDGPNPGASPDACMVCRAKWILVAGLMRENAELLQGDPLLLDAIATLFELDPAQATQYTLILATTRKRLWAQRWCQLIGRCH